MSIPQPTSYQDIGYLTVFPLISPSAVLNYFATSPFFDETSNNQSLRIQGVDQTRERLINMTGIEYLVEESLSLPPRMFVILKQKRINVNHTDLLEAFYCLDGVIYPCPNLIDVIRVRFAKITMHLEKAFHTLSSHCNEEVKEIQSESQS
jgi:mediator of RNA polymerase II transcription subunit 6